MTFWESIVSFFEPIMKFIETVGNSIALFVQVILTAIPNVLEFTGLLPSFIGAGIIAFFVISLLRLGR